jgi:DNA repair protein RadC
MTREDCGRGQKPAHAVHDHPVIGRGGHTSFKALGLM